MIQSQASNEFFYRLLAQCIKSTGLDKWSYFFFGDVIFISMISFKRKRLLSIIINVPMYVMLFGQVRPLLCKRYKRIDGMVLSGRCISGTSEAHGSYRTQGGIMGIGQASGVLAGLCAIQEIQPKDMDVEAVQKKLIEFGASVFRNEEKKAREEAHAKECVRTYMKKRDKYITKDEIMKQFFK